ncbi:hypothetical protein LOTGIDRAFT_198013 [Lottia gigantea]|uniref:SOCS box domain-containing protein n=1 Tax=Lottia gigantea TaxID=225164 RepID=V4B2A6_LOTGI|nr:hypothetical protein LOTGIDRAFT_198013 [Lottia gigantea]ESO82429.1 hypothetical protein LOTGIDRAFT_198013 [Lottia gigantea]
MRQSGYPHFLFNQPNEFEHCESVECLDPHHNNNVTKHGIECRSVTWALDYSYIAWSSGNCTVQLIPWNREQRKSCDEEDICHSKHVLDCKEAVWSMAFGSGRSQNSRTSRFKFDQNMILATGLQSGRIKIWNCRTGLFLMVLFDHKDTISSLHFAPDSSMSLLSASHDGTLKLWDLNDDGNMFQTLRPQNKRLHGCRWSPNTKYIASVGDFKSVVIWRTSDFKLLRKLQGHYNNVTSCDFSPDGALLATASYDTRVIIWDFETGEILRELGHMFPAPRPIYAGGANEHYIRHVAFSCDGTHLASVCDDGYTRVWNLQESEDPEKVAVNDNALCCSFSPDGTLLSVGNRQGVVEVLSSPRKIERLQHLARSTVRKHLPTIKIDHLHLPFRLKEYLKYKDI